MTGVGDILSAARRVARRRRLKRPVAAFLGFFEAIAIASLPAWAASWLLARLVPEWWRIELRAAASSWPRGVPRQHIPDGRDTLRLLEASRNPNPSPDVRRHEGTRGNPDATWALLLPLTSRGHGSDVASLWHRLERNLDRLAASTRDASDGSTATRNVKRTIRAYVAVDLRDGVFDSEDARARIAARLRDLDAVVFIDPLPPAYQGNVCWIWSLMARTAAADGADHFVLLGDDVEMLSDGWLANVEEEFESVAIERGLPYGCACVAIRDVSFPCFPTFPVVHKFHLEAAGGELFPREFRNQHGDPFLFEIYRRWGASRFARGAELRNQVGGKDVARYEKAGDLVWRGRILTDAIASVERLLCESVGRDAARRARVPCLDVVVPTYRCDVGVLRELSRLECIRDASVHTLIVVDRPEAPTVTEIKTQLASYEANKVVRVLVMPVNAGAAHARNTGMFQSFGDHCVLLDDDVTPEPGLLDAYIAAIDRHPDAAAYVGLTSLPLPVTAWQRALAACRICYFYGIATVTEYPPWGVTANICVRGRTNNSVMFDPRFPRSGGGEDVDFCIKLQQKGFGRLVSVPDARVTHPFWKAPLRQISGWASGDVLCLDTLPHRSFLTLPDWAEISLFCAFLSSTGLRSCWTVVAVVIATEVAMLFPRFYLNAGDSMRRPLTRAIAALMGVVPPMIQDATRLWSKVRRARVSKLLRRFDWMNGTGRHGQEVLLHSVAKSVAFVLVAGATGALPVSLPSVEEESSRAASAAAFAVFYAMWFARQTGSLSLLEPQRLRGPSLSFEPEPGVTPFVVLAYQRTGSNLLCGLLSAVPGVNMHFEVFNEKASFRRDGQAVTDPDALRRRDADPCEYFREIMRDHEASASAVGFKLFPEHATRQVSLF